jgi:putative SOS response-associated peptidase YedK
MAHPHFPKLAHRRKAGAAGTRRTVSASFQAVRGVAAAPRRAPPEEDNPGVCSNYQPVTRKDRLLGFFGVERERDDAPVDTWPTGLAPFIRLAEAGSGNRRVVHDGVFGLLPAFAKELAFGRRTYNARSETVHQLPSFRDSWRKGWRCIVPAEVIYEPFYAHDAAKAERWAIYQPGALPMGIAGIYT